MGKLDETITFNTLEPIDKTINRIYDWSYERIVPKEVLEKIEEYM